MKCFVVALLLVGCKADKGVDNMPSGRVPLAAERLDAIAKRARAVFGDTKAFPIGTSAELPERNGDIIAGGCCGGKSKGTQIDNKCPISMTWANDPVWKALGFSIGEPELYRYKYTSTDGKSFVATATGDADCDDEPAVFTARGTIDASGDAHVALEVPPRGKY